MRYQWAEHQIFNSGQGAILLGVDQASLFCIDAETRQVLARFSGKNELDLEQAAPGDREILEELRDLRMLVPAAAGERRPAPLPDPAQIPLATMVLEVAQDCNLRCRYCYAEGGSYGKSARLLDPELARKAVRLLLEDARDQENLTLILFGGEPLLNMEAVRAAVQEVELLCRATGKKVFISLTTNGTLLTPEITDFLRLHRVGVSVSMDGPADLHDANRAHAGGKGSYAGIVSRLSGLFAPGSAPVAARVTLVPEQWSRIEEVFDHLRALGFHEVGISPASPINAGLLPDADQEELLFQGFSALAARFVQGAAQGTVLPFSNIIDLLARLHVGQTKSVACGAGFGYLAVDAGGDFYLCHRLAGEEAFQVGDIDSGPDARKITAALRTVTAGKDLLCEQCWARTMCGGGCHYENHLRENHLGLPQGSSCDFIRRWLQLGIETYAELRSSGGEAVLQMLGKRAKC
jgi:uncharacterized protein